MSLEQFFVLGSLAHGTLSTSYLKKIDNDHREKIIYLLAHIFITFAMLIRIDEGYQGHIVPSILGTVGHSLLLLFFLLVTIIFYKKYRIAFSGNLYYLNILCILAQIGMIIIYWHEYFEGRQDNENENENGKIFHYLKIIVFSVLSLFYLLVAFKFDNKYSLIFVGLLLVSILYMISLYLTFNKYQEDN